MSIARTGESPAANVCLEWLAEPATDERGVAMEAVAALKAFLGSWFEPLAIEATFGCYDRDTFQAGKTPPIEFQMLVIEPRPEGVEIRGAYRATESHVPRLTGDAIEAWIERGLMQSCGDPTRLETTMTHLEVRAAWIQVPPGWIDGDELLLDCYAGTIPVLAARRDDTNWVATAPVRFGLRRPIQVSLDSVDGSVRFMIEIYWTPWVGELARPESPLAQAVARLVARGWQIAAD